MCEWINIDFIETLNFMFTAKRTVISKHADLKLLTINIAFGAIHV